MFKQPEKPIFVCIYELKQSSLAEEKTQNLFLLSKASKAFARTANTIDFKAAIWQER